MNAFKRLTIENFQSHKKTVVEPAGKGQLTVIVGPSDSGKTAVIRALRWLLFNDPQGDQFIRVGATLCRVTLELESGHTVVRERSRGGINRYKLISPGKEAPDVFEGFGVNVPLEVVEVTGVRNVKIGDLDLSLNLSEQLDGPFLGKSISSGARAKVLGKLAGTEEIDYAGAQLNKDLYHSNQAVRRLDDEIKGLDEQIEGFKYLDGMRERIERVEELVALAKEAEASRAKLAEMKRQLVQLYNQINGAQAIINRWVALGMAKHLATQVEDAVKRDAQLRLLGNKLFAVNKKMGETEQLLGDLSFIPDAESRCKNAEARTERVMRLKDYASRLHEADKGIHVSITTMKRLERLEKADDAVAAAEGSLRKRQNLSPLHLQLLSADRLIKENQVALKKAEENLPELEQSYIDELSALGICPVCGGAIDPIKVLEVV